MSERKEYFAFDALTLKYACSCGMELIIKPGRQLHIGNGEARCPGCHGELKTLRHALENYSVFIEEVKSLAQLPPPPGESRGELKFQLVISERAPNGKGE